METQHSTNNNGVSDETYRLRRELFKEYVEPYLNMIYKLCIKYTSERANVHENYVEVLTNMYKYIETYNAERPIRTWLHIVTKRCVFDLDDKRHKQNLASRDTPIEKYVDYGAEEPLSENVMGIENWRNMYSDDVIEALDKLKPIHRDAIILQQAGFKIDEIADIEFEKGHLKNRNIETVKSRLFLARQTLQNLLTRDGKTKVDAKAYDDCAEDDQ